jgi:hypothetical protein
VSLLHLNGSTLSRLVLLALLLAASTHGFCSLFPSPRSTEWLAPSAGTGSARPVLAREVDEWLPVSLSCRRVERFGSSR